MIFVLLRRGVFGKHVGRQSLIADVNQAVFFTKGSTFRVSHPSDCGDRGTVFTLAPQALNDTLREFDPATADQPDQPFPFVSGPCDASVFWRHRDFLRRLEAANAQSLEPMWAEVTSLQMIADILAAAFTRCGKPPKRHSSGTLTDHADHVEAMKTYLACRLGERIALADVSRSVHASPFHLARIFRQHTLADSAGDLTSLAIELGFSTHSHFADTFRREFGRTPSEVRKGSGRRTLGELSKNLEG